MQLPEPTHINDVDTTREFPLLLTVIVDGDRVFKILDQHEAGTCIQNQLLINTSNSPHLLKCERVYECSDKTLLEYERLDRELRPEDVDVEMVGQIFECIDALEDVGLRHHDLHYGNFMFRGDTLVLIDYSDDVLPIGMYNTSTPRYQLQNMASKTGDARDYFHNRIDQKYPASPGDSYRR